MPTAIRAVSAAPHGFGGEDHEENGFRGRRRSLRRGRAREPGERQVPEQLPEGRKDANGRFIKKDILAHTVMEKRSYICGLHPSMKGVIEVK